RSSNTGAWTPRPRAPATCSTPPWPASGWRVPASRMPPGSPATGCWTCSPPATRRAAPRCWSSPIPSLAALLPLDGRGRLAAHIINNTRNTTYLIDNPVGNASQEVIRQVRPVGGHEVDGLHRAQRDHPLVGAGIADHAHRLHRQE